MTNELVVRSSVVEIERAAKAMVGSGFFQDTKQVAQAMVKIMAGEELGFGPFASMTGVNIIQNKPVLSANLMAAAVKRGNKYNYRILTMTNEACELEFYEDGKPVGKSKFTIQDAGAAGLTNKQNWKQYPRNMLFARALSNGQKWYCPDVFNGATVYTPDELGANVNEDGNVIDVEVVEESVEQVQDVQEVQEDRPYEPVTFRNRFSTLVGYYQKSKPTLTVSDTDRKVVASAIDTIFNGETTMRYEFLNWLTGESSTKKLTPYHIKALLSIMEIQGFGEAPTDVSITEIKNCHSEALREQGQQELPIE